MSGLRAKIAEKKRAAAEAERPPAPSALGADQVASPVDGVSAAEPARAAPTPAGAAPGGGGKPSAEKGGFGQGFLNRSAGALYPEGSTEAAPPLWASTLRPAKPVLELVTLPDKYEVVGRFQEAGNYLGKEDFEVTRNGNELRVKGNPQNDPQS